MNVPMLPFDTLHPTSATRAGAIGRSLQSFARALAIRISEIHRRTRIQRETRAIFRVLHGLDDRTLRDLGFHRCEIWSVAAESTGEAESTRMRTILHPRAPR